MMGRGWVFCLWVCSHLSFINGQISSVQTTTTSDLVPGLYMERQFKGPTFTFEPSRIDFLNEVGASITCHADGYPKPQIHWQGSDNKIVSNVDNFRTVLVNSTLILLPFKPAAYRQDIHSETRLACIASNSVGAIRSRDIQVRAVIAQQWSARIRMIPRHVPAGIKVALLLKCEVDLMGGGRDFIQVTGWERDGKLIGKLKHSFYGVQDDLERRFHVLPNGDLVIHYLTHEDSRSRFVCLTRHKLTDQEISSSSFMLPILAKSLDHGVDETNIPESFAAPMMIRQGDPLVLHCYELFFPSTASISNSLSFNAASTSIRWEKLTGNSWSVIMKSGGIDTSIGGGSVGSRSNVPLGSGTSSSAGSGSSSAMATMSMFFRQVGSSLVSEHSVKVQAGNYRCIRESTKEKIRDFDVRIVDPLTVTLTINQEKAPLESVVELRCIVTSSSTSPSIIWLKDANVINPGGRVRLFSTNILQINQIQRDDQGMYQCLARTDMESAQASVRLELADASPRLIYGFIEQTLAPGPSVSLRCAFQGWPAPKVSWLLDNWVVSPTHDNRILIGDHITSHGHVVTYFNISQSRVEDGGTYSCFGSNRNGSTSHSARLNIYGAPWIRMVPPVVAISSEYFSLKCPIAGWPISFSAIVWEKDGQKLPVNQRQRVAANGTLIIPLADKMDQGIYICGYTDMQGRIAKREIQVNVVAPLRITLFPESSQVMEGERLTLVCTISSGDTPVELRWTMIPTSWKTSTLFASAATGRAAGMIGSTGEIGGTDSNSGSFNVVNTDEFTSLLKIQNVSISHAGLYFCAASSAAGQIFRRHNLTVFVPPKIEPFFFQENLVEAMRTRLVCGVSQGDLPIHFTWYKDDKQLTKDDPWTSNIEISTLDSYSILLSFSKLSEDQAGTYTCFASNPSSKPAFHSAKLEVQVAPRWLSEPQDVNVSRGSESRFECVGYGIPTPKVSWAKLIGSGMEPQWKPIDKIWPSVLAQGLSILDGNLVFASVEEIHEGKYMCSVNNGIGSGLTKVVNLHVNVQPYFVGGGGQTVSLTLGRAHEVICEAVSSSPVNIVWSKGSNVFTNVAANRIHTVLSSDGKRTRSTLVLKDVRSDDNSNDYHCTASNSLGRVSQTYRLVVEEPPGSPVNLRLLRGTTPEANRVYLEWDAPLLGKETHERAPISGLSGGVVHVPGDFATSTTGAGASAATSSTSGGTTTTTMLTTATTTNILSMASPPILRYVLEFAESTSSAAAESSQSPPSFSKRIEIAGEKTQVKVDNLSPASVYLFRVRAINSAGSGPPSAHLLVRTANVPPSVSPNNVRAAAVSSNAIQISWSPIPIEMSYGKVLAYRVVIGTNVSEYGKTQVILVPDAAAFRSNNRYNSSMTFREHDCCQTIIHGLRAYTHYEVRVAASNVAGDGPLSMPFTVKTAEAAPSSPPRNAQCVSLTSHSIQITWQNPAQPNGPVTAYKVIFYPITSTLSHSRGSSQRPGEIHRTSGLTSVIGGLQPSTNYSLQISPVNIAGEGSQWLTVFCKTSEDLPSPPSNLIGYPSSESSVYITWLFPRKPNGVLTHHTVYYRIMEKPGDSYDIKRTVSANVDSFEENGLDLTRFKYIFWVTSSNRLGESQPSPQLILTPPPIVEPRLVGHSRSIITQPGSSLSLPCRILGLENLNTGTSSTGSASILPLDAAVSWTLNGKRVGFDGNVYMKPGHSSLSFFGVKREMMGNYTCQLKYITSTRGTHSKSTSKRVINGMDHSSVSFPSSSSSSTFPAQLSSLQHKTQLTYSLIVKGPPCIPEPAYELRNRDIHISWRVALDERDGNWSCYAPLGFILYFRTLGSILDWQKLIFQPTLRNHTLKNINCGAILNMYMLAFNEYGTSGDSPMMSVVVSQQVGYFPPSHELIVANVSSVRFNFYSLNANSTYCPTEKIGITLKEWRGSDGVTEKDVKFEFRNEYWIDGLKPSTPYEIVLSAFGYSTSRTASFTFTTLTEHGETPSEDVLSTHKVTSELAPLYRKLKYLVPVAVTILAIVVAIAGAFIYCQTKKRRSSEQETSSKRTNEVMYGHNQRKSIPHEEQYYSGLPCPPTCTPGLEDISPYATFQISDPKKFCEESFSQEIVVAKFHPVMHGVPRGSRDKWMDRDPRHLQDSEDSESESTQRYSVIPPQRPRLNNTYQISPPQAYHYRQQQQEQPHHHHLVQQQLINQPYTATDSDGYTISMNMNTNTHKNIMKHSQSQLQRASAESDESSGASSSDLSMPTATEQRRHSNTKDRRTMKKNSKDYGRGAEGTNPGKGSSTNTRHGKRKSGNSDYSIAV